MLRARSDRLLLSSSGSRGLMPTCKLTRSYGVNACHSDKQRNADPKQTGGLITQTVMMVSCSQQRDRDSETHENSRGIQSGIMQTGNQPGWCATQCAVMTCALDAMS